ncbi:MAG: SBBP repeat-containing protein [Gammaproteobacteria bacterium]|nr:SBBP repeat-containing protein [Gammaproteobacteria bacterium]
MSWIKWMGAAGLVLAVATSAACSATSDEVQGFAAADRPELRWAQAVGDVDADADEIDGISVDPDGNTLITGVFRNRLVLGDKRMHSRGAGDIFLASIDPDGRYRWVRRFGGTGDDNAYDLTTDARGNLYVSGWFSGEVDFGGTVLTSAGSFDQFIAKYDPSGELIWARSFGGPKGDGGNEIAVLADGRIAVSAISEGDFAIDGHTYRFGGGRRDSFAIRMTPDGEVLWVVQAGGSGTERIRAINIAPAGDVYVGFEFRGRLDFGTSRIESRGGWDGALARLTPEGRVAWVKRIAGPGREDVRGVAVAPDGSVYVSGGFGRGAVIAGHNIPKLGAGGDDFLLKLTPDGQPLWLVTVAGRGPNNNGPEIVADAGGVVASGLLYGPVRVRRNRDVVATLAPPGGRPTSYLAAFDPTGMPRFVYTPSPRGTGAGAFGDVLSLSRDGKYLAQAIRFRRSIVIGDTVLTTPSHKDSAVIFFRLRSR